MGGEARFISTEAQVRVKAWARGIIDDVVVSTFSSAEAESAAWLTANPGRVDVQAFTVAVVAAVALLAKNVFGDLSTMNSLLRQVGPRRLSNWFSTTVATADSGSLPALTWWVGSVVVWYFLFPSLVVVVVFRQQLRAWGLRAVPLRPELRLFWLVNLVAIPVVILVSSASGFRSTYPFLDIASGESLGGQIVIWELLYFTQFVAVEFFFRGFIVLGMRRRLGWYSVLVMVIPYCMIHFQKPPLEAAGAIVAGLALGTLSLRSKSIWLGAALHCTVALTMDLASLWRDGHLF
jgi:uncharacterized protein